MRYNHVTVARLLMLAIAYSCILGLECDCFGQGAALAPAITLPPKLGDKSRSLFACQALVHVSCSSVPLDGTFEVICECRGTGEAVDLYNPFLSERWKLPAQLIITSADGRFRREILHESNESKDKSDWRCWVSSDGRTIGRKLMVTLGKMPKERAAHSRVRSLDLAPGEYYIQAIYTYWLVAARSESLDKSIRGRSEIADHEPAVKVGFDRAEMDQPMAVSEPAKLIVTGNLSASQAPPVARDCPLEIALQKATVSRPANSDVLIVEVPYRITNQSEESLVVFNSRLDTRFFHSKQAVELAILTTEQEYLGNCFNDWTVRSRIPQRNDWERFPPGGTISSTCRFRPDLVQLEHVPVGAGDGGIGRGRYLLELRAHAALLAQRPAIVDVASDLATIRTDVTYKVWFQSFPGPEICHSNRVELEILPLKGD